MKFGRIVLEVNVLKKSTVIWGVRTQRLPDAYAAVRVRQFLIHSISVLVFTHGKGKEGEGREEEEGTRGDQTASGTKPVRHP